MVWTRIEIAEIEEPKPAGDEVLIDVHAASVSFMDQLLVSGGYQMRPPTPFVPGTEGAGVAAVWHNYGTAYYALVHGAQAAVSKSTAAGKRTHFHCLATIRSA